jgi:hypothetical protein
LGLISQLALLNALEYQWDSADRTLRLWQRANRMRARSPAAWWESAQIPKVAQLYVSPCRHANNTFDARKQHQTSALRKFSSQTSLECMASGMAHLVFDELRIVFISYLHAQPPLSPRPVSL